ncbi:hypothetical protein [Mucilaginibacter ginkgonis]|uniref:Uncharacterized protein n=1 Tax=Mucilaginibacter ginkgonis TaxID=2682091 RepID=A0A6I4I254_9SPHI|nr:hypothetical protein [Mucilaginibacter ginkgonis]QQL48479.1 hypothetical protein GO620_009775 [Mucilaginibacter ginkgonis]
MTTIITKEALKMAIEKFFDGFFDFIEFYMLPRGIGFTGHRFDEEHTAYVELKQELVEEARLNEILGNFKSQFLKDKVTPIKL